MHTGEITTWLHDRSEPLELGNATLLPQFENCVAEVVAPKMNATQNLLWMSRIALDKLIRPPKFFGVMANTSITTMDEAYDRLIDARRQGRTLTGKGQSLKYSESSIQRAKTLTQGFAVTMSLLSIKGTPIEDLSTEVWYVLSTGYYSSPLLRYTTQPVTTSLIKAASLDTPKPVSPQTYISNEYHSEDHLRKIPKRRGYY
jgi:hypothetical protein